MTMMMRQWMRSRTDHRKKRKEFLRESEKRERERERMDGNEEERREEGRERKSKQSMKGEVTFTENERMTNDTSKKEFDRGGWGERNGKNTRMN